MRYGDGDGDIMWSVFQDKYFLTVNVGAYKLFLLVKRWRA